MKANQQTEIRYQKTQTACFVGYIVQAVINNFLPLLFVTLQNDYKIPLSQITSLITVNFCIQLGVDLLSALFIDKIGYRRAIVAAHIFASLGLLLLGILPSVLPSPYMGLLIAVFVYALGGGLLEVLVSPIIEALPTPNKEKAMSLLHSFYCWGHMGVILLSTLFFTLSGIKNWKYLAVLWSILPLINAFVFLRTPIVPLQKEGETGMGLKELLSNSRFWLLMLMMICSGASEQAVSQWSSAFAEDALGLSKSMGDLFGPMTFAFTMGISRLIFGKKENNLPLDKYMNVSCLICIGSYLLISLTPYPVLGLIGCAVCGFAVGIMWPGSFSTASKALPRATTAMYALLALGGDLGCSIGPTVAGLVSSAFADDLKKGILAAIVFPIALLLCLMKNGFLDKKQA